MNVRKIDWRSIIGLLALLASIVTVFSLMVYGSRTLTTRVAGTVTLISGAVFFITGGLGQLRFFRSRQFFRGSASTVYTVGVIGILVLVNVLGAHTNWRWDVTASQMFTLSEHTVSTMQSLDQNVEIRAFFPTDSAVKAEVESLLRQYEHLSNRISVQFIDPERQPALTRQYEVTQPYTTVVESGGQRRYVAGQNLYDFSGYMGNDPSDIQFRGEQTFTRVILQLTRNLETWVYFVTGHGEPSVHENISSLDRYLAGEGYRVNEWNMGRDSQVPENADVIVLGGPTRDLHAPEVEILKQYVDEGGRLLVLLTASEQNPSMPHINELLNHIGVQMRDDVVVDPSRAYYMDPFSPVPRMDWHPITEKMVEGGIAMTLPFARSLMPLDEDSEEWDVRRLLFTSSDAWSETNPRQPNRSNAEVTGVLALGYAVSAPGSPGEDGAVSMEPTAVVFGSSTFITNDLFGFQGNADLFVNSLQWLIDRPDLITIRPKAPEIRQVFLTPTDGRLILYGNALALPFIVLLVGSVVWMRRKNL